MSPSIEQLRKLINDRIAIHRKTNDDFSRGALFELEKTLPNIMKLLDQARFAAENYRERYMIASGEINCPSLAWQEPTV